MSAQASEQKAGSRSGRSPSVRHRPAAKAPGQRQPRRRPSHEPQKLVARPPSPPDVRVSEGDARPRVDVEGIEELGGARLLATDIRTAFVLFNEARYRALECVGVPREQANLMTFIATLAVAGEVGRMARQLSRGWSPTRSDRILGVGLLNALGAGIAGPSASKAPFVGLVVGSAVVASASRRALHRSAQGMKASAHRMKLSYSHRYARRN